MLHAPSGGPQCPGSARSAPGPGGARTARPVATEVAATGARSSTGSALPPPPAAPPGGEGARTGIGACGVPGFLRGREASGRDRDKWRQAPAAGSATAAGCALGTGPCTEWGRAAPGQSPGGSVTAGAVSGRLRLGLRKGSEKAVALRACWDTALSRGLGVRVVLCGAGVGFGDPYGPLPTAVLFIHWPSWRSQAQTPTTWWQNLALRHRALPGSAPMDSGSARF